MEADATFSKAISSIKRNQRELAKKEGQPYTQFFYFSQE